MTEVRFIEPKDVLEIRKKVLRKNIDLPSRFNGDTDKTTFHLGFFIDHRLVSVVSLMQHSHPDLSGKQYQLRGMATLKNHQKKGYGRILLNKALQEVQDRKADYIWCNARIIALDFYRRSGCKTLSDEFFIPQIGGHFVMVKKISE